MSKEAVVDFFQTLEQNPALSQRITAIEDPTEVVKIAKSEMGYNFTTEELNSAVAAIKKSQESASQGELSEDQLESVAGGFLDNWKINIKVKLPSW